MYWEVVDKIESLIESGQYAVGSRLPSERELSVLLKVSRPTVREAIIALEARGRVEVKLSSGVYVLEDPSADSENMSVSAFELTQARALIEGESAALAAMSINDDELEQLEKTLLAMENGDDAEVADKQFHEIIAKATRNHAIMLVVEKMWSLRDNRGEIHDAYQNVCESSDLDRLEEHRRIFNALKVRDSQEARAAMHYHFNRLINSLFEASEARDMEEVKKKANEKRGLYSLDHVVAEG